MSAAGTWKTPAGTCVPAGVWQAAETPTATRSGRSYQPQPPGAVHGELHRRGLSVTGYDESIKSPGAFLPPADPGPFVGSLGACPHPADGLHSLAPPVPRG